MTVLTIMNYASLQPEVYSDVPTGTRNDTLVNIKFIPSDKPQFRVIITHIYMYCLVMISSDCGFYYSS